MAPITTDAEPDDWDEFATLGIGHWSMLRHGAAPRLILLLGLPGSGKTTWRTRYLRWCQTNGRHPKVPVVLSTDDVVDTWRQPRGLDYHVAFHAIDMTLVAAQLQDRFARAVRDDADILVDRTNLARGARDEFLRAVPGYYRRIAVSFEWPFAEIQRRVRAREVATGKVIPPSVLHTMAKYWQPPRADEFDEIIRLGAPRDPVGPAHTKPLAGPMPPLALTLSDPLDRYPADPGQSDPHPGQSAPHPGQSAPHPGQSDPHPGASVADPGASVADPGRGGGVPA